MLQVGHDVYFKQSKNTSVALYGKIWAILEDEIVFMLPSEKPQFIFVPRTIAETCTYSITEFAMMVWGNVA